MKYDDEKLSNLLSKHIKTFEDNLKEITLNIDDEEYICIGGDLFVKVMTAIKDTVKEYIETDGDME